MERVSTCLPTCVPSSSVVVTQPTRTASTYVHTYIHTAAVRERREEYRDE